MSRTSDQNYLLGDQYRDASKLNARINLHARFSTNRQGWMPWVFDQIDLPAECRVLELGSGPGGLWKENLRRIPPGWEITLSDLSPGMIEQAQKNLSEAARPFSFRVIDAQSISFDDDSLDGVIANHMLYHVPDRERALGEIRRVLKPGGRLYATTVGENHLRELGDLFKRFDLDSGIWGSTAGPFTLENGGEQLARYFSNASLARYPDSLEVTEAEPLVAYLLSMSSFHLSADRRDELARFIEGELQAQGAIHITKDSGMFKAA